ncbi:Protein of unknown function DUF529 [Babesia duncani]|uniref:Uncharacterized protein n=1 Tax=Babesia duncani TaxID=323732 RepID=A0AAD9PK35_9APIC|nr:Protein of unknown function DUF529 [Babesia duncani]
MAPIVAIFAFIFPFFTLAIDPNNLGAIPKAVTSFVQRIKNKPCNLSRVDTEPVERLLFLDDPQLATHIIRPQSIDISLRYYAAPPLSVYNEIRSGSNILWKEEGKCFDHLVLWAIDEIVLCGTFTVFDKKEPGFSANMYFVGSASSAHLVTRAQYNRVLLTFMPKEKLDIRDPGVGTFTETVSDSKDIRYEPKPDKHILAITDGGETLFSIEDYELTRSCESVEVVHNEQLMCFVKTIDGNDVWHDDVYLNDNGWILIPEAMQNLYIKSTTLDLLNMDQGDCDVIKRKLYSGKSYEIKPNPGFRIRQIKNGDVVLFEAKENPEQVLFATLLKRKNVYLLQLTIIDRYGHDYTLFLMNTEFGKGEYKNISIGKYACLKKLMTPNFKRTDTCKKESECAETDNLNALEKQEEFLKREIVMLYADAFALPRPVE